MLNVRCDNVFLLYESLISVEQRRQVAPVLQGEQQLSGALIMRKTAWIWFVGFAAWLIDGLISLHLRDWLHARLAMMVAIVFLTAGFFYRRQT
jgi:hypothetical protein